MKKFFFLIISVFILFVGIQNTPAQTGYNTTLEFCTGTWCQWCPCGDNIIHSILTNYPNTLVLAYHGPQSYSEHFSYFNGYTDIYNAFGWNAFPTGCVGRKTGVIDRSAWGNPVTIQTLTIQPGVTITVSKSYNSTTHQLQFTANVTSNREIDTVCYINFIIVENGIVYTQTGNSNCPGSSNWVHDWVVRNMVNGGLGEQLNSGNWTQGTTITKNWTTTLDNTWVDANCEADVLVYMHNNSISTNNFVQQTLKQSVTQPVGIGNYHEVPLSYSLSQNYPNPFNPTTNIKFSLPKDGFVSLKIYDITGAVVQTYLDGFVKAGTYHAEIDGSNLSSGVYFYTLKTNDFLQTKKMILIK